MKRKIIALLAVVMLATAFLPACGAKNQAPTQDEMLAQLDYDEEVVPDPVRNVVILKGTWYEMGQQYASQMPDVVKRCVASGLSDLLSEHTYEEGLNALAAKDAVRQAGGLVKLIRILLQRLWAAMVSTSLKIGKSPDGLLALTLLNWKQDGQQTPGIWINIRDTGHQNLLFLIQKLD